MLSIDNTRKFIQLGALLLLPCTAALFGVSGNAGISLETRHLYRGQALASAVVVPKADFFAQDLYGGFWGAFEVDGGSHDEIHLYLGTYQSLHPLVSFDAGALFSQIDGTSEPELYAGAVLEYRYRPSFYLYRNFERNAWFAETALGERVETGWVLDMEWRLLLGTAQPRSTPGWTYLQGTLDWIYPLGNGFETSFGLRGLARDVSLNERKKSHLWAGFRLDYEF